MLASALATIALGLITTAVLARARTRTRARTRDPQLHPASAGPPDHPGESMSPPPGNR